MVLNFTLENEYSKPMALFALLMAERSFELIIADANGTNFKARLKSFNEVFLHLFFSLKMEKKN